MFYYRNNAFFGTHFGTHFVLLCMAFILAHPKNSSSTILLSYKKGLDTAFRYSTGQSVEVNKWDKLNQRAIKNSKINYELERYENYLNKVISYAKLHDIDITKAYLYNEFEKEFKLKPQTKKTIAPLTNLVDLIQLFIDDSISGRRKGEKGLNITIGRIAIYKRFKKSILEFNPHVRISEINYVFYQNYNAWLTNKGLAISSVGTFIIILVSVLRYTHKIGLHNNKAFESGDFKAYAEAKENVYLTTNEIDDLWDMPLKGHLKKVRDLFIIALYTGVRISDLTTITQANIVNNGTTLKIIQHKTKGIIFIPIHPRVRHLIEEYSGFPSPISDQKMNDAIKVLCQKAGFTQETIYKKTIRGKVEIYKQQKWERVTNHTARRSFATNCVLAGIPERIVMKWTGHKDIKSFELYICVTTEEMLLLAQQNKFFKT